MDTLASMQVFARVVDLNGFAVAARSLRMSPAMVSKHIAHLERRLGVALLTRTTRRVAPTEAGARYHAHCVELLRGVEEAEHLVGRQAEAPSGTLRVTAPVEFGDRHLAPLIPALLGAHPDLAVSLDLSNRVVDLAEEGLDVAIRIAPKLDTALAGRRIATSRLLMVAAPAYLERHRAPRSPDALRTHAALCFAVGARDTWHVARGGATTSIRVVARMLSTSSEALRTACLQGAGIAQLPTFLVGEDLRRGALVPLLPGWDCGALGVYTLFAQRRYQPARVRAFVDALLARFGEDPEADPFWTPASRRSRG